MDGLRNLRKDLGLSQEEMAKRVGVTLSYYQKVEQGQVLAAAGFIRKFRRAFPAIGVEMFFTESR